MTSTSVKDVGSAFANLYTGSAQGAGASVNATSFQQVWNSQVSRGNVDLAADVQTAEQGESSASWEVETSGKSEKPNNQVENTKDETAAAKKQSAEKDLNAVNETENVDSENAELSEEELEEAMEVLSAAAAKLMQQIAETFGVSMEELSVAMDELGMSAVDVLDATKLGELMLNLGGASDSYALVTDEMLYDNYRALMNAQKATLESVSKELGVDSEQLGEMIARELQDEMTAAEELLDEMSKQNAETESDGMVVETSEDTTTVYAKEDAEQSTFDGQTDSRQSGNRMSSETPSARQGAEVVMQNVTVDSFQAQVQQTESIYTSTSWDADTQNIMRQIMDYMKIQVNAETTSLEMQLHPASLGTIRVNIASNGGVVTANFVAQNEAVKAALESQMIQLRETFAEQGVKVEAIEVTVQTHQFEQNLEQGRGGSSQENGARRNRTRRINLNDPVSMENMEEEDVLAAEMLTAGGSTVDYTA